MLGHTWPGECGPTIFPIFVDYNQRMRKNIWILILALLLILLTSQYTHGQAQNPTGADLANAVNDYRVANGLAPLAINDTLMGIAQAQADYNQSNPGAGHTGPGGTRPIDRARAAGYGGGATVSFFSENWACGSNLSVQNVINSVWQDDLHRQTMLGTSYRDIGAGASVSGDIVCYIVDVGAYSGQPANTSATPNTPVNLNTGPTATPVAFYAIVTSTPNPDGSVIHVVQPNQFLVTIAQIYGIPLADLLRLNNLDKNSMILPGTKIIIRPANTATPTYQYSPTPTYIAPSVTATRKPQTPTPTIAYHTRTPTPTITPTPKPPLINLDNHTLGTIVLTISGLGAVALIVSFVVERKKPK